MNIWIALGFTAAFAVGLVVGCIAGFMYWDLIHAPNIEIELNEHEVRSEM